MSSTNRGKSREANDKYFTPVSEVALFLREFDNDIGLEWTWHDAFVLDPCAGGDKNHPMSYPEAIKRVHGQAAFDHMLTIDIREDSLAKIKVDYLTYDILKNHGQAPNIIITNPPFGLCQQVIEKALNDVCDDGWVIMLLRLNYFGSISRKPFFDQFNPRYCYVHHKRMSFTGDKRTDSIEYAHFVWNKGIYPTYCQLKVI